MSFITTRYLTFEAHDGESEQQATQRIMETPEYLALKLSNRDVRKRWEKMNIYYIFSSGGSVGGTLKIDRNQTDRVPKIYVLIWFLRMVPMLYHHWFHPQKFAERYLIRTIRIEGTERRPVRKLPMIETYIRSVGNQNIEGPDYRIEQVPWSRILAPE